MKKSTLDYNHIQMNSLNPYSNNPFDSDHINVYHCCWKSFKKIGFVTFVNPETGEVEEL
jgi:hypothetical protein